MAEFPYMPMYWDAYLGDTTHLSTIEHGAYLLLLGAMWRAGGTLPADDKTISRITGLTLDRWRKMKPTIMAFMHPISGDRITQNKLCETKSHVSRLSKGQSARAKAMWLKRKGLPDAMALTRQSHGNANQISKSSSILLVQSSTPTEEKKEAAGMEQAEPSASIEITSALRNSKLLRKAS